MSEKEQPEHWVEDGILFCNTVFKKREVSDDKPFYLCSEEELELCKSLFDLDFLYGANPSDLKGHSSLRFNDGTIYVVSVSFSEVMRIKKEHAQWRQQKK